MANSTLTPGTKTMPASNENAIRLSNLRVFLHKVESAIQTNRDSGQTWVDRRDLQLLREFEKQLTAPETFDDLLYRIHRELARGHSSAALAVVAAALEHRPLPVCTACDVVTLNQNAQKASEHSWPETHYNRLQPPPVDQASAPRAGSAVAGEGSESEGDQRG